MYQIIPKVLEDESKHTKTFIVCVVSPLEYIRKQQVVSVNKLNCGLRAVAICEDDETDKIIEDGSANIGFASAEHWLSDRWRQTLQFGSLHGTNILVVDEVNTL